MAQLLDLRQKLDTFLSWATNLFIDEFSAKKAVGWLTFLLAAKPKYFFFSSVN